MTKLQLTSVGSRYYGEEKVWTLMSSKKEMINIPYHPFLEKLYPRGQRIPCIIDIDRKGKATYSLDFLAIYENIYEEDCEYEFNCREVQTEVSSFKKYLILEDEYGFEFRLFSPSKDDLSRIGKKITCKVTAVTDKGLDLCSLNVAEGESTLADDEQVRLFNKLHDSRTDDFKVFNKKSYRGYFNSLKDKYPDSAHFIYELLQNADDAKASSVQILLNHDSLIFKHNGSVHFTISDVDLESDADYDKLKGHINSITGIGDSSKLGDEKENKIGKFGVGFKSVFQYTDAPEIYDDFFHFRIRNYIIPESIEHDHDQRDEGETLIFIPFLNPQSAYDDIIRKLRNLANATLFLNHMESIRWKDITTGEHRKYEKNISKEFTKDSIICRKLSLTDYESSKEMWMFTRKVDIKGHGGHDISTGVYLNENGTINTDVKPSLFCFFPTSESFGTCVICHAPFILTEDRQHLLPSTGVNRQLVSELGQLAADSLPILRDIGTESGICLIDENIIQFAWSDDINRFHYYSEEKLIEKKAITAPCLMKVKEEPLLLSRKGLYLLPEQALRYSPAKFADILDSNQLTELKGADMKCDFVCPELNKVGSFDFWEQLEVCTFELSDLSSKISEEFMKRQSQAWLNKFFRYVVDEADKDLWRPDRDEPCLLDAPIIKTRSGNWIPPFLNGNINVFYSDANAEGYNIVADEMMSSKPISKFLEEIGCRKPDASDFILSRILPKYSGEDSYDVSQLSHDLICIYEHCSQCKLDERYEIISKLKDSFRVLAVRNGEKELLVPSEVYIDTESIKDYFKGFDEISILDSSAYKEAFTKIGKEAFRTFLSELGCLNSPKLVEVTNYSSSVLTQNQKNQLGLDKLTTTWRKVSEMSLEGLENALKSSMSKTKSQNIWKWVLESINQVKTLTFKYQYYQYYTLHCDSCTIELLRNNRWIVDSGKALRKPHEISLEEFSTLGYVDSFEMCKILGIASKKQSLAAMGASKEQIEDCEIGALVRKGGLTREDLETLIKDKEAKRKAEIEKSKKSTLNDEKDFLQREEMSEQGKEMFSGRSQESKQEKVQEYHHAEPISRTAEDTLKNIQERYEKAVSELDKDREFAQKKEEVRAPELKYTKKWFQTLLELEYLESPRQDGANSRAVSITFSTVRKEAGSERILVLKNPNRSIPIELEDIGGLEVRFQFLDRDEFTKGFEVASVRDFTLRLKATVANAESLAGIDWSKCTQACVDAHNPVELTGKFIDAFNNLDFDDCYYDDEDEDCSNPNLKENLVLHDNIRFIYGPPGTGKTTELAKEIIELINDEGRSDVSILVLAPTNRACDEVALKIREIESNPEWAKRFVATDSEELEELGMVCGRDSMFYNNDKICLISTMARLPYDGFRNSGDGVTKLKDMYWDYIFVDEASMVSLAHSVFTIYQFPDSEIIFAGDPKQIPPIVHEESWQDENIYTMVGLSSFDNPTTEPRQFEVKRLMTQYRSVPAIGEIFSRYSYDGKILHSRKADEQKDLNLNGYPIKTINLIPFKVERYDNIFGARKLAGSPVHLYSVILAVELCRYISLEYERSNRDELTVGIICPYASEAQMIDKLMEQQRGLPENVKIQVGTIHGFQGGQCDVIFVVFNPPTGLAGIRGEDMRQRIFLNRQNIINVGISRARDYMFILLPHSDTAGYENLTEIDRLGSIIYKCSEKDVSNFTCDQVEKFIFGRKFFIENNMFATTHQLANVYTKPEKKYEIRIDDNAVDIQMG